MTDKAKRALVHVNRQALRGEITFKEHDKLAAKIVREGLKKKKRARKNPPLQGTGTRQLRSHGATELIGIEVHEIFYRHATDGKAYHHEMESDAILLGMPDGSLRIESTTGKRLWKVFK
jgi:hypothetical protein